jgi:hypothetical protein
VARRDSTLVQALDAGPLRGNGRDVDLNQMW